MDRNLDERLRKPRRAKGTPFAQTRSYYSLAFLAFGAFSLYLFELLPSVRQLKSDLLTSDRYKTSPVVREHIQSMHISINQPELKEVIVKYNQKKLA